MEVNIFHQADDEGTTSTNTATPNAAHQLEDCKSIFVKDEPKVELQPFPQELIVDEPKIQLNASKDVFVRGETSAEVVPTICNPSNQTPPQNVGVAYPNYILPNGEMSLMLNLVPNAGITLSRAAELNYKRAKHFQEFEHQRNKNSDNLLYQHCKNLEEERHKATMTKMELEKRAALSSQNIIQDEAGNFIKPVKTDWRTLTNLFIDKNMLVFERINGLKIIWKKDSEYNRHIAIDDEELKMDFVEFVEDQCENVYASEAELNRAFKTLKYKIPSLKKSDLTILDETQLPFANGYFDIKNGKFTAMTPDDRYFNQFAMPYAFNPLAENPDAFDAMLADMFDNDEAKMHLAYQLIGAMISSVSTLKRIYVFQGVSHGGKTRLANIIIRLIDEDEVHSSNTVSEITGNDFSKKARKIRLAYIKDGSKRTLGSGQAANLKSYADGGQLKNSVKFKILICTNHKITSDNNDFLEPALRNRFVVLPFAKEMDNTSESVTNFEDYYFAKERDGIVNKALAAFQEVLQSGRRFSQDYPINAVVEATAKEDDDGGQISTNAKIKQVVEEIFDFTDNCDLPAKEVFASLKEILPDKIKDPPSLGRRLSNIFGDTLETDRNSEDTLYNLAFKPTDSK